MERKVWKDIKSGKKGVRGYKWWKERCERIKRMKRKVWKDIKDGKEEKERCRFKKQSIFLLFYVFNHYQQIENGGMYIFESRK